MKLWGWAYRHAPRDAFLRTQRIRSPMRRPLCRHCLRRARSCRRLHVTGFSRGGFHIHRQVGQSECQLQHQQPGGQHGA